LRDGSMPRIAPTSVVAGEYSLALRRYLGVPMAPAAARASMVLLELPWTARTTSAAEGDLYRDGQKWRHRLRDRSGNINQSLNLPPNSSVTYKATGFINGNSGTVISNTANVSVPAGVSDPNTANNIATDKDTIQ